MTSTAESYERPLRRRRADLEALLGRDVVAAPPDAITICLVAGPKDHGPGEHEYELWQRRWTELLASAPGVTVRTAFDWPSDEDWRASQLVVCYFWHHDWTEAHYASLDAHLAAGRGVVAIHSAVVEDRDPRRLAERYGLAGQRPRLQYRHGPVRLRCQTTGDDPVQGLGELALVDEAYWQFDGDPSRVRVLATSREAGRDGPQIWTHEVGRGRVFCATPGHFAWTFDDPVYRLVLLRGMAWAARQPLGRWQELAAVGVELAED